MPISLVNQNSAGGTSVSTLSVTLPALTSGNFSWAAAEGIGGSTGLTIKDGSTDTYTDSPMGLKTSGMNICSTFRAGAFFTPTAGVTTYTATFTGGAPNFSEILAAEITGYGAGNAAWDQFAFGTSSSASTMSAGPTGTLAQANEFVFGYLIAAVGAGSSGQPSGWTLVDTANDNGFVYNTVAVNTAVTATCANTPSTGFDGVVMTFKTASATITLGGGMPCLFIRKMLEDITCFLFGKKRTIQRRPGCWAGAKTSNRNCGCQGAQN